MAKYSAAGFEFTSKAKKEITHVVITTSNDTGRGIWSKHSSRAAAEKATSTGQIADLTSTPADHPYHISKVEIVAVTKIG